MECYKIPNYFQSVNHFLKIIIELFSVQFNIKSLQASESLPAPTGSPA
nr:MAG TPA: hypothetical protein [Caudoviricetes sp.]